MIKNTIWWESVFDLGKSLHKSTYNRGPFFLIKRTPRPTPALLTFSSSSLQSPVMRRDVQKLELKRVASNSIFLRRLMRGLQDHTHDQWSCGMIHAFLLSRAFGVVVAVEMCSNFHKRRRTTTAVLIGIATVQEFTAAGVIEGMAMTEIHQSLRPLGSVY